jgi:hypothetical protein
MGQRFALVAVEKNDVPRLGLLFAQLQAQAHASISARRRGLVQCAVHRHHFNTCSAISTA